MSVIEESTNPYPRMLSWEVWNFMSIKHGKVEFDEKNIINLKGYNDSGKSAMLTALKVLLYNVNSTKQVSFIHDGEDYFRVLATFADGVQILRDKYINGQSLYEMYKDGQLLYSSKSGKALTKISEVPQPIADYLGLIMYDNTCLNSRACFEKQIGVQTTGSENYKMFNTVLKSEEIATAATLLNNDKNKLSSDINATEYDLQAQKNLLGTTLGITQEMVDYLKEHDTELDSLETGLQTLAGVATLAESIKNIPVIPELSTVSLDEISTLDSINNIVNTLATIQVAPEVASVDDRQLTELTVINGIYNELSGVVIAPELSEISDEQLRNIAIIEDIINSITSCSETIEADEKQLKDINEELTQLQTELANKGIKMVRCPDCGAIFNPEDAHVH